MNLRESLSRLRYGAANGAASSARALHTEANNAADAGTVTLAVGFDANGAQPYVVGGTSLWWRYFGHDPSMEPAPERWELLWRF